MADIRAGLKGLDGIIAIADNAKGIGPTQIRDAMESGIPEAQKLTRKYLVGSLRSSGIKSITGSLLGMIKRSVVSIIDPNSKRVALRVSAPSGLTKKDYQKMNSLNYGAVRRPKNSILNAKGAGGRRLVGDKQLSNLKSKAQSGKVSSAFTQVSRDIGARVTGGKTSAGSTQVDTTLGTVSVTKAWKFFKLSNAQLDKIKEILFNSAMEVLANQITGKRRSRRAA